LEVALTAWKLKTAKARLNEVVRAAEAGPQTITVRGREAAVVIAADEYRRITAGSSGKGWVDELREGLVIDFDFDFDRVPAIREHLDL
jgi:prevent-host-death family protein